VVGGALFGLLAALIIGYLALPSTKTAGEPTTSGGTQDPAESAPATSEALSPTPPAATHPGSTARIPFGSQDTAIASLVLPGGAQEATLLYYDVRIDGAATPTPRAALVSFRIECDVDGERVDLQADGKTSTNIFLARGGTVSGQALTPPTDDRLTCRLLSSAPFIDVTEDGLSSLQSKAELRAHPRDGTHHLALPRLDDATLVEPGQRQNVLSLKVEDPASIDQMVSTVRLTSCTVVGGSRDSGDNKCATSMTGRDSSTVRVRVFARWLDDRGSITGVTTYWDETLAVNYSTHHIPWTLRQQGLSERAPEDAPAAVLVVQVESVGGTPVVVHADGTDAVVTTGT